MKTKVWLQRPFWTSEGVAVPEDDGGIRLKICVADATLKAREAQEQATALAYPERVLPPGGAKEYCKAREEGVRSFVLWADRHRQGVQARVVTKSAAKGRAATYEVLGTTGESVALIVRERALNGGFRTRWTVQPTGGPTAVGRKGNPFWWGMWWLLLPLQAVFFVGIVLAGQGDLMGTPRRTKWRAGGKTVLDWASGASTFQLTVADDRWDPRVTAALVLLLDSHSGPFDGSWDDGLRD
ncbi:hypothetical protein ACJ6WF_46480 [Streptomyces sp. MMS24-I2-30]|uniref:hypothetical protein n=1 Tax=Streptomyces sp. MMS24-I2-30 TaxID=3351564 RepID=UPI003896E509